MKKRSALREIERKIWFRTFEHGLWDILIGMVLLLFGLSVLTEIYWLSGAVVPIAVPGMRSLTHRLVAPRIGHATFHRRRQRSTARLQLVLAALVLLGVVVFALLGVAIRGHAAWAQWFRSNLLATIGFIWGCALAAAAWAVDLPRLYAYGLLLFVVLLATNLSKVHIHFGHALCAVGGVIILAGVVLLVRFVQRYPRVREPMEDGSND